VISKGRSYFPNLDGLRFFAFIHVFISHAFVDRAAAHSSFFSSLKSYLAPGFFGIDLFFVLSGFLITWTLLEERFLNRSINLKNYFARRSLRIWPLYFLLVGIGFAIHYLGKQKGFDLEPIPDIHWFLLFILNFYISINGPYFMFLLVFLWSVAVEEQFYVLWGFAMRFLKRSFPHLCIILILASLYFRYTHLRSNNMLVFHSLSVAGNFACGALFAHACFYKSELFKTLNRFKKGTWVRIYVLLFVLYALYSRLFNAPAAIVFEKFVFAILFCLVLYDQCFNTDRNFNAGSNRVVNYLGKISYGLYCFHGLVLTFVVYFTDKLEFMNIPVTAYLLVPLASLGLTILMAHLSYRYFETPFLNLKKKFYL
jgi:peptidoglycan/LPS O-acetylase OafA/YrhL